jgi:hypothetical protein
VLVSEALMVAVNRWSQGRYNAAVWPCVLIASGLERLLGRLGRWLRAALAALALVMLVRLTLYHRLARTGTRRVAIGSATSGSRCYENS